MRRQLAIASITTALLAAGCSKSEHVPTSVFLTIANSTDAPTPTSLLVQVFNTAGVVYPLKRVPESGELLASTDGGPHGAVLGTIYVGASPEDEELRFIVRGMLAENIVSEGTVAARVRADTQTPATVTLEPGHLPDTDQDGVPDNVDNCALFRNPLQGECAPDAGVEINSALEFDGVDDQAVLPLPSEFGGDFTFEMWIKTNCSRDATLFDATPPNGGNGFKLALAGGKAVATIGNTVLTSSFDVAQNQWVHLAVTRKQYNPGRIAYLLVNGHADPSGAPGESMLNESPHIVLGGANTTPYCGLIDEVRLWRVYRTSAEILATKDLSLSRSDVAALPDGTYPLAGSWHFDEGDGWFTSDAITSSSILLGGGIEAARPSYRSSGAPIRSSSQPLERL